MGPGYESDEERWRRAYDRERSRDSWHHAIAWFWNGALGQPFWMKVVYGILSVAVIAALFALFFLDAILNG